MDSQNSAQFELGFWIHTVHFIVLIPLTGHVNTGPCFEYACWHALLWPVVLFKWLWLIPAQDGKAQHFKLAKASGPGAKLHSPQHRHTKGVSIVYLQFSVEIPKFFIVMNNWAVWSGHSTKSCSIHSEAWGGGSLSSMSRGGDTHSSMAEILEHSSLPLQLSLPLRATSPPLCLQSTTLLSPQSQDQPASTSRDTPQTAWA